MMDDQYLWDGTGTPDPEIERLEKLLAPLGGVPPFDPHRFDGKPMRPLRAWTPWLAAAAMLLAMTGTGQLASRRAPVVWNVDLAGAHGAHRSHIANGDSIETGTADRATVSLDEVGELELDPNTRLRLVHARIDEHRMALERGRIRATIWAPPRKFVVDTPSAAAVDLGCEYTLQVDEHGDSLVQVETGWVAFERNGRESLIPAGASCVTRRNGGPGSPFYTDTSDALRRALHEFEVEARPDALHRLLAAAQSRDAITLWHLLRRTTGTDRELVYQRMALLAPPPPGVTHEGIIAGEAGMLDRWWDSLGLDDASWFRIWKQPAPR